MIRITYDGNLIENIEAETLIKTVRELNEALNEYNIYFELI